MKVTLERAELVKALAHVHRVVERRNTIPILANVLIKAGKNGIELKATDLDLEIQVRKRLRLTAGHIYAALQIFKNLQKVFPNVFLNHDFNLSHLSLTKLIN